MAMAQSIEQFLQAHDLPYDLVPHPRAVTASRTAEASGIPGDRLAKSVLLQDDSGYVVAVLPATCMLDIDTLRQQLDRDIDLAGEDEVVDLFCDCDAGAIPALGNAYDVETIIDDSLLQEPEVWFESGDHEALIHMSGRDFRALMADLPHGMFAYRA